MVRILDVRAGFKNDSFDSIISGELHLEAPLLKVTSERSKGVNEPVGDNEGRDHLGILTNVQKGVKEVRPATQKPLQAREFYIHWPASNEVSDNTICQLDDDRNLDELSQTELYFMLLLSFNNFDRHFDEEEQEVEMVKGLMLEPTGSKKGEFKRSGTAQLGE